ncbi:uncharacterized protein LOC100842497 [Brachypodium distachyon]|uniref:F-box domain-containing protein n=1 Tax=Brachypodium distachyon TaxID=15368 RepID=A0A2K2DL06_BRADI|nr:uncharacterized protein LOC100842497 [Brachypodium distachyon]PNT74953.1 hypothetical protein BRADI_1g24996v3 [Brachypodium distachyon]|eukprot:XP_003560100.2 uncharacterized protein LOC100842497 [Brachypodium distachyon]
MAGCSDRTMVSQSPTPPPPTADDPPLPSNPDDSPTPNSEAPPPPPEPLASLPDELLEEILLCLPAAADLARASTTCASFRHIVAPLSFVRRFRSLHKLPVLGFLRADFYPAQPPHPSAPAAHALAQSADFTFSFLPNPACWSPRDVRDGRVLFSAVSASEGRGDFIEATSNTFVDLVVCDPLSRRYVQIPPVPEDLAAPVEHHGVLDFEPFFAPASEADVHEDSSFGVICKVLCENKVAVFVFSSRTGEWSSILCHGLGALSSDVVDALYARCGLHRRHYAHGFFCWVLEWMDKLLMLDPCGMKFSIIDLPSNSQGGRLAIVEAGEGKIGLLNIGMRTLDFYSKIWRNKSGGTKEWQHNAIDHPLPNYHWCIIGADEEYLLLRGISLDWPWFDSSSQHRPDIEYFAFDLKTLQFERMYVSKHKMMHAHLYRGFPPLLSPPSL